MSENYDLIVIGSGPGGHAVAEGAANHGAEVCIIEKSGWGGTCTHQGCVPTKALLSCSKRWAEMSKMKRFGIAINGGTFDFKAMKQHQQQMTRVSALGVEKSLKEAGAEMKAGEAILIAPGEVQWESPTGVKKILSSKNICIAWGSQPTTLPTIQTGDRVLTSDGFLNLVHLPKQVIIIGGSVVGIEFATLLAELGVHVTIIEVLDTLLPLDDEEAVAFVKKELNLLGVVIHAATNVKKVIEKQDAVQVWAENRNGFLKIEGEYILLCTGRKPRLYPAQLAALGILWDGRGIHVDTHQESNIPGIYAIGDVTGGIMLAHRAMQQGRALVSHLFGDGSVACRENFIPSVVYSHPPMARVGLTEKQATAMGLEIDTLKLDYGANIMARTELVGQGFAKFFFHEDQLVGASIIGVTAGDLIASLSLAMTGKMNKKILLDWIIPHPALSEILCINPMDSLLKKHKTTLHDGYKQAYKMDNEKCNVDT